MSKSKNKTRLDIIIFLVLILLIFVNVSSATIDCSACHKTVAGKAAIKAADTIEIDKCSKCHNPNYPPTLMGYNTHLVHVGKYSANVDYLTRHPKAADSINCDNCHVNIGQNCQSCHTKNLPHLAPPLGYNCKGCHGELDKLFRHPAIDLKIHDIFNVGDTSACAICHNPDNMVSLKLANGEIVAIQESHRLCYQCHSDYYNLWNSGVHYSNKTIFTDKYITKIAGMGVDIPKARANLENKWRKENTCANCHNAHNPRELYKLPVAMEDVAHIGIAEIIGLNLLYIVIFLIIMVSAIIIFIIKKKKIKLSELRLSELKLPKISIPISISIEEGSIDDDKKVDKKVKTIDNEIDKKVDNKKVDDVDISKTEKKKFLHRHRKDILFVLIVCTIFGSFYVVFGTFIPVMAIISESMSPNIEKGDIIFYADISKINEIGIYDKKISMNFGNYGDVIIYKPFGKEDTAPYIHRAMYYVNQDDDMWKDGPKAPHAGYITKGDNSFTNPKYDQQGSISMNQPVKKEWIIGIAKFRIPYLGYIRLMLS